MRAIKAALIGALTIYALPGLAQQVAPAGETALLAGTLSDLTSLLGAYVAVLAGTSALAVALLEAYKKLFSIRGKFHRTAVIRWLAQDTKQIPNALASAAGPGLVSMISFSGSHHYTVQSDRKADSSYDPATAYAELFHLTSGQRQPPQPHPRGEFMQWRGIDRAVFELDTGKMMSQVQDAADAVLNNPARYPQLYTFLTRGAPTADTKEWAMYITSPPATGPTKAQSDLYGRIRLLMRRQLDAFQCVTVSRWDDLNQLWAVIVGAVILFVALLIAADPTARPQQPFLPLKSLANGWEAMTNGGALAGVALKSLLGGALAPIAKDLLNKLTSLKFAK